MLDLKSSVHKTFAILEYFTLQKPEWGVTELSKEIGANKSTVFRFLAQMHSIGILDKNVDSERYRLGLRMFELGNRVELRTAFIEKTHAPLESVAQSITETVHIAVLKNYQVFYVDKIESPHGLRISSHIGSYNPAYATSLGKVLLAYLSNEARHATLDILFKEDQFTSYTEHTISDRGEMERELTKIKGNGYAIDREEYELGLICVAVPIFNQNQQVVASLSASGPASRFRDDEIIRYVNILNKGAKEIQSKIGNFKIS